MYEFWMNDEFSFHADFKNNRKPLTLGKGGTHL